MQLKPIDSNPYLAAVMRAVRSNRPMLPEDQPFYTRVEKVPAGNYVEVWFRTGGCTWDRAGGCTMCNYGFGPAVDAPGAVASVAAALDDLDEYPNELMISPSGGMWDPLEVPTDALRPIYDLAAAARPSRFLVETRAETVTAERLDEMRGALPGVDLAVEVGLESAFDPVLAYCVNKGSGVATFDAAARSVHAAGATMYANVSLGTAFLDRAAAVRDAVGTVRWALDHGADTTVLFPLHIKPFTLLDFLAVRGRYRPVTLWDLVDALAALGAERAAHVEIAWYKSYYDTSKKITTSPTGCGRCHDTLMDRLDRYRATLDFAHIDELVARRCSCAPPPALHEPRQSNDELADGVLRHYDALATDLDMRDYWHRWQPRLEPAVHAAFAGYAPDRDAAYVAH
jgi:radical SAM enzyme (TIGR01210 family)